ncbi:Spore protein SP21 [Symmachiella dynata]|uniref:Hsp20/alpha crystallin family protein n=1 Tax=Symmachiella dynata TaxID=2527995 RepID=UPI00118AF718|nr:Hsp20/alpha crystallin family protein [Symmachiella dynata]QDT47109.1 Spore protein SP21 [Symmachiella dynata]
MTQTQEALTKSCCTADKTTTDKMVDKTTEEVLNPRVDISETNEALILTVDLPGVAEEDVDITLHKQVLTIEAKKTECRHEGVNPYYVEHSAGLYQRRFKLTEEVDRDGIDATLKDGVLRLTLPKAQAEVAQKIKVMTA